MTLIPTHFGPKGPIQGYPEKTCPLNPRTAVFWSGFFGGGRGNSPTIPRQPLRDPGGGAPVRHHIHRVWPITCRKGKNSRIYVSPQGATSGAHRARRGIVGELPRVPPKKPDQNTAVLGLRGQVFLGFVQGVPMHPKESSRLTLVPTCQ
jgi:hypothetical protein